MSTCVQHRSVVMTQFCAPLTASETLLKLTINHMGFQPSMVNIMKVLVYVFVTKI